MKTFFSTLVFVLMSATLVVAQPQHRGGAGGPQGRHFREPGFKQMARMESLDRMPEERVRAVADTLLAYQFPSGGWAKNHAWQMRDLTEQEAAERAAMRRAIAGDGVGSTIDNDATTSEMQFLCKAYSRTGDVRYRDAAVRGVDYLLAMQYANGGWPQYWPSRPTGYDGVPPYADHITFNDNAMVLVMRQLWSVAKGEAPYDVLQLSAAVRERCQQAFDRGVQCILDCQIVKDGKRTVWCQQHDEKTLAPARARAYELPSFTGNGETCGILQLLMELPNPSPEVVASVTAAVDWLKAHAMRDKAMSHEVDSLGRPNRIMVDKPGSQLWARFYDLETEQPYYCDRDGIKRSRLSDIGYERRNGYGWAGEGPLEVFAAYDKWIVGK